MTDAEIDARLAALSDEDLRIIAEQRPEFFQGLRWYRPGPLYVRMAREILELRQQLAVQRDSSEMYQQGKEDEMLIFCDMVTRIIDGKDSEGTCREPWESVRRRLLALVQQQKGKV